MEEDKVLEKVIEKYKEKDPSKGTIKSLKVALKSLNLLYLVVIVFRAIGNAPILKQKVFKLAASNKFQTVIQFLRKELRYQGPDPLVSLIFSY